MVRYLTNIVLKFIIQNHAIDENNEDIVSFYQYGIEITISSILNIILIFLISLLLGCVWTGILFLFIIIPTRQYTGGYHANSYVKCHIIFSICYILTLILAWHILWMFPLWLHGLLLISELCFIAQYCPISNKHKPIHDNRQLIKNKIVSSLLFTFWEGVGIGLIWLHMEIGYVVLSTLHMIVALGTIGLYIERLTIKSQAKK